MFTVIENPQVLSIIEAYPTKPKNKLLKLRKLIFQVVKKLEGSGTVEETLKWGEPSYVTKKGSTFRMDWKEKNPEHYALYFNCNSLLVPTFKSIFGNLFTYEGKRAIVFNLKDNIPKEEVKACIHAALTYHKVKGLPMLGL
ncbi:MAG: DUF1801 domain-containing protein [Saprospiraceae bacterium]|nr:DUF1801 domain-containing protein [Saprospiraceae bacterium]